MTRKTENGFGQKLYRMRRKMDVTQTELAEIMGTSQSHISLLESGDRNPSLVTIRRLADALGVSPAELLEDV